MTKRGKTLTFALAGMTLGFLLSALTEVLLIVFLPVRAEKSPPFPQALNGIPVNWVPDEKIRKPLEGVTAQDIRSILLTSGHSTLLPNVINITSKQNISRCLYGLSKAQKLSARLPSEYCNNEPDQIDINFEPPLHRKSISIAFYADVYEQSVDGACAGMGTISPEFQDALRCLGVPEEKEIDLITDIRWTTSLWRDR